MPEGQGRAKGQLLIVKGRVIDPTGTPVAGADIEIWQANSVGRYAHPDDTNPAPLDPNFEGDPYHKTDSFLQSVPNPEALIVKLGSPGLEEPEFMVAEFDIVFRG